MENLIKRKFEIINKIINSKSTDKAFYENLRKELISVNELIQEYKSKTKQTVIDYKQHLKSV